MPKAVDRLSTAKVRNAKSAFHPDGGAVGAPALQIRITLDQRWRRLALATLDDPGAGRCCAVDT
jgi:hypothetical protein